MKRIIIVTVSCLLLLVLFSLGVMLVGPSVKKVRKALHTESLALRNKPLIITPNPKTLVSGVTVAKTSQTYTSLDGGYSITYPKDWTPSIGEQIPGLNGDVFVFDTGPVGNQVLGFPSFLQVAVDDNPNNMTLTDFINKHFSSSQNQTETKTVGGITWTVITGLKNPVPTTVYLFQQNQKIYQIKFYDGTAPQITPGQIAYVLSSLTIH